MKKDNSFLILFILCVIIALISACAVPSAFRSSLIGGFIAIIVFGVASFFAYFFIKKHMANKRAEGKAEKVSNPENETSPVSETVEICFDVENVTEKNADGTSRQAILKRIYKLMQKDTMDALLSIPDCTLYPRANDDTPDYVIYLDSDRIGDVPREYCSRLYELITSPNAKLLGLPYTIDAGNYDPDLDDLLYECTVTVRFEVTK